jgi:SAM-dependent methyltransferase
MQTDFLSVTEIAGDDVSREQVDRLCQRYYWAAAYCRDKDVLEVACGTGPGLGYLAGLARSLKAGDYSEPILEIARRHYGTRIDLSQFDAQEIPCSDASLDVVLIFEAIYYIPSVERFLAECARVLRPGGHLLIVTANRDLYDFNPSPHSHTYLGVKDLRDALARHGFDSTVFGNTPVTEVSWKQRLLRPVKKFVVASGLMPKSMAGKKLLKRLVFGNLVPMPAEITADMVPAKAPTPLPPDRPDMSHKVIFCAGKLRAGQQPA